MPKDRSSIFYFFLFLFSILFMEIFLKLGTSSVFWNVSFVRIILFTLSYGFFLSAILALFKEKIQAIISSIMLSPLTLYFLIELFTKRAYNTFFTIEALLYGSKGVVTGFDGEVITTVVKGFCLILLFLLPLILSFFYSRHRRKTKKNETLPQEERKSNSDVWLYRAIRICLALIFALSFFLLARWQILHSLDNDLYTTKFDFSLATERFGLLTSTRLDITQGPDSENQFILISTHSQTEATEETCSETSSSSSTSEPDTSSTSAVPEATETQAPSPTPEPVYEDNVLDIDFAALAEKETNTAYRDFANFIANRKARKKNQYTGIFEGFNLILLTAEAFDGSNIREDLTPTLYRMANKGIHVKEAYQPVWGGSTSSGEYSILMGLVPSSGVNSMVKTQNSNLWYTIGNQLRMRGYQSQAYQAGDYN